MDSCIYAYEFVLDSTFHRLDICRPDDLDGLSRFDVLDAVVNGLLGHLRSSELDHFVDHGASKVKNAGGECLKPSNPKISAGRECYISFANIRKRDRIVVAPRRQVSWQGHCRRYRLVTGPNNTTR